MSVRGRLTVAGKAQAFAFHFVVSTPDNLQVRAPGASPGRPRRGAALPLAPGTGAPGARDHGALAGETSPGDLFSAPYSGPGQNGPMIFDEAGNVVWFDPVPSGDAASNLQVQQLDGKPVLSWWQGYIPPQGFGEGEEVIVNSDYELIGRVYAGNGLKADLHDFHITPQNTAVMTVFDPIDCNLSAVGGPHDGAVTDAIFQEIDLRTGLVRREWTSLDHVPLSDSYSTAKTTSTEWPFDYFHLNSIDQLPSGRTLISARNTWTLYELNTLTGQILLRIGGKHSEVKLASGAATAFQHDATMLENGTISVFDNGGVPKVHPQSRGLVLAVNPARRRPTRWWRSSSTPPRCPPAARADIQQLANGDMFVGWGAEPYFSEFSASGQLLFDGHMHGSYESYRTYRFPWVGTPTHRARDRGRRSATRGR